METKAYIKQVLDNVKKRNATEPEFLQTVKRY